ncbi:MAG: hypothetical protein POELPBGB_03467 [Bacteroidia bacterium]|nr:hypothetical protein [Bacteroidia bacterium]
MKITFLGHGYEPESKNSVGNYLLDFLSKNHFHTFTGISAFASEAGILGLADHIETAKRYFKNLNLIVGIDQEGTSKEALIEIYNLKINSYIFHQEEPPIFHPKIYLFEGIKETKLILGSSNMTARGLFGNVESSLLVEFLNTDKEGKRLLAELKDYYKDLFNFTDPNLFKITKEIIQGFIDKGIVPNEVVRTKKFGKQTKDEKNTEGKPSLIIPKRQTSKIPIRFRGKSKTNKAAEKIVKELEITDTITIEAGSLVWQKKKLPSSDAQQVKEDTNVRGVIGLSDSNFKIDGVKINRNTYFRNEVFAMLNWSLKKRNNNSPIEEAFCDFNIKILGKNLGVHKLRISHDAERAANQNNITTTIHWGSELITYLRNNSIIGKTLSLYYPVKGTVYSIIIE